MGSDAPSRCGATRCAPRSSSPGSVDTFPLSREESTMPGSKGPYPPEYRQRIVRADDSQEGHAGRARQRQWPDDGRLVPSAHDPDPAAPKSHHPVLRRVVLGPRGRRARPSRADPLASRVNRPPAASPYHERAHRTGTPWRRAGGGAPTVRQNRTPAPSCA